MAEETLSPLTKELFGYRRSEVDQMLGERERYLRQAEARVAAAEQQAANLKAYVRALLELNRRLDEQNRRLRDAVGAGDGETTEGLTQRLVNEQMTRILASAQQSAAAIVERAREVTTKRLEELDRMRLETNAEIGRYAAWRARIEPDLSGTKQRLETVAEHIASIPQQVRAALAPLASAVTALDHELTRARNVLHPPQVSLPVPRRDVVDLQPVTDTAEPVDDEAMEARPADAAEPSRTLPPGTIDPGFDFGFGSGDGGWAVVDLTSLDDEQEDAAAAHTRQRQPHSS